MTINITVDISNDDLISDIHNERHTEYGQDTLFDKDQRNYLASNTKAAEQEESTLIVG